VRTEVNSEIVSREIHLQNASNFVSRQRLISSQGVNQDYSAIDALRIAVIGDSTAADFISGMDLIEALPREISARRFGLSHRCLFGEYNRASEPFFAGQAELAERCDSFYASIFSEVREFNPHIVFISFNWYASIKMEGVGMVEVPLRGPIRDAMIRLQNNLSNYSQIFILGKRPAFLSRRDSAYDHFSDSELTFDDYENLVYQHIMTIDSQEDGVIREVASQLGVLFFDFKNDIYCDHTKQICHYFGNGDLFFRDSIHWTSAGAQFFTEQILRNAGVF
jgi:hypothetical protein